VFDLSSLAGRLEAAAYHAGLEQTEIAAQIGVAKQTITAIKAGKVPGKKHLPAIAAVTKVDPVWLASGGGDAPEWARPQPVERLVVSTTGSGIPYAGSVTAGGGWVRDEDDMTDVRLRAGLVAVRVRGDSAEPYVYDGEHVLADPNTNANDIPLDTPVVVQTATGDAYCKIWSGIHAGQMFLASIRHGVGSVVADAALARVMPVVGVLSRRALSA
jgi:phage repressor protein C with HTH and peptisase S24 domain